MADPLSVTASALAIVTAAIVSARSLREVVSRYESRDKTLQRLMSEVDDLLNILNALDGLSSSDTAMLKLLNGPISRSKELCDDFKTAMEVFGEKPRIGLRNWAKMEFKRGDINEFIDSISGYKATISVGVGAITLQTSQAQTEIIEQYSDLVQDTMYHLKVHLQSIEQKIQLSDTAISSSPAVDLEDERAMIVHCIRICENATFHIDSLTKEKQTVRFQRFVNAEQKGSASEETYLETQRVLAQNRDSIAKHIGRLQERLSSLVVNADLTNDLERDRLKEDIKVSEQSLQVCQIASSEVSRQKAHTIGEAIADGDSDQVVVTTWAELFDVKKAVSRGRSAQLVGSFSTDEIIQLSKDRYGSRFGSMKIHDKVSASPPASNRAHHQPSHQNRARPHLQELSQQEIARSNEFRKRTKEREIYKKEESGS